ncbi:hypothetical protein Ancab_017402 [Ancistrocladus abbreviatus]
MTWNRGERWKWSSGKWWQAGGSKTGTAANGGSTRRDDKGGQTGLRVVANRAEQTGFISIDCGLDQDTTVDTFTGILYTSDAGYTDTGVNMDISQQYINDRALAQSYKNVN